MLEVVTGASPCTCAGALLTAQGLAAGTCGPCVMLMHRDRFSHAVVCVTVFQPEVLCPAVKSQINS